MVLRRLTECLGRDRTKHQVAEVTSLGLVQMTRKRVGQGLIEAFSTTCESCHGRGIHIHMDPVPMAAHSRNFDDHSDQAEESEGDDVSDSQDFDSPHEPAEPVEPDELADNSALVIVETPVQSPLSSGRRGRRRVSSGGVITPSV